MVDYNNYFLKKNYAMNIYQFQGYDFIQTPFTYVLLLILCDMHTHAQNEDRFNFIDGLIN